MRLERGLGYKTTIRGVQQMTTNNLRDQKISTVLTSSYELEYESTYVEYFLLCCCLWNFQTCFYEKFSTGLHSVGCIHKNVSLFGIYTTIYHYNYVLFYPYGLDIVCKHVNDIFEWYAQKWNIKWILLIISIH